MEASPGTVLMCATRNTRRGDDLIDNNSNHVAERDWPALSSETFDILGLPSGHSSLGSSHLALEEAALGVGWGELEGSAVMR